MVNKTVISWILALLVFIFAILSIFVPDLNVDHFLVILIAALALAMLI